MSPTVYFYRIACCVAHLYCSNISELSTANTPNCKIPV